ncbi:MAG: pseudouridine synthase [Peptostreptococcaceae bacterium]
MRINKFIASCTSYSRRKAEEVILDRRVKVNNEVVETLSYSVNEDCDVVEIDGQVIHKGTSLVYIMLNKPEGYITTVKDQFDRPSVIDLVKDIEERIYPIGRLDYETSGLLLLTNDGDLTYKLTHPKHEVGKMYMAIVKGMPTEEKLEEFRTGLYIEDYKTAPAKIQVVKSEPEKYQSICKVEIHEGKNRQVRKMFRAINNPVLRLKRVSVGKIFLDKELPYGEYRHLTKEEVNYLKGIK